jgi:DNA-binding XRE family transcriptional regulator
MMQAGRNCIVTRLKEIRESLGVTQEMVARRTSRVSMRTYVNAENGKAIKYSTAMDILNALNSLLAERNRQPLTLDDLGLNLE